MDTETRVDQAAAPTAEEARAANAGEYAPRGVQRLLRNLAGSGLIRLAVLAAALKGAYEVYERNPAAVEFVTDIVRGGETASDPEVFDPEQSVITLTRQNTTAVPPEQIGEFTKINTPDLDTMETFTMGALPRYRSQEPILEIPLPFEVPENSKVTLRYTELVGFSGVGVGVKERLAVNGLPKDTIIYAPFSGEFSFSQNNSGNSSSASLSFKDARGHFRKLIFLFGAAGSLIDEIEASKIKTGEHTWEQEIYVEAGTSLFMLDEAHAKGSLMPNQLSVELSPVAFKENGEVVEKNGNHLTIHTPIGIATLDNKAVTIENN